MREKEETEGQSRGRERERETGTKKRKGERIISIMQHPYLLGRYSNINYLSWVSTR